MLVPLSAMDAFVMWVEVCLWASMAELGCKTCKTPFKTLQDIMLSESKVVHMGEVHGVSTNGCPQPPPRVTHGKGVHGHACGLSMVAPLVDLAKCAGVCNPPASITIRILGGPPTPINPIVK